MEPNPNQQPTRGRARGRARPPPQPEEGQEGDEQEGAPDAVDVASRQLVYSNMFSEQEPKKRRNSDEEGSNGNGSNGNGKKAKNGDGPSDNSGSPTDSGRGGIPRGGTNSPQEKDKGNGEEVTAADYVVTRPSPSFMKKGDAGSKVKLIANYYRLQTKRQFKMCLYEVKITPTVEEERKIRAIVRSKREELGPYMLSGFIIFTTLPIRQELLKYQVTLEGEEINYTVEFGYKREVSQNETLVVQFHNILVRQIQRGLEYELIGRHYFDEKKKVGFPNWRLELWPGFQNSIRQQEDSLMLNIESVWKVVKTDNVLDIMKEIRQREGMGPRFEQLCREAIIGLSVITNYNRRAYRIDDIDFVKSPKDTFPRTKTVKGVEVKTDVRFADYYQEQHKVKIEDHGQPLLVSRPTKRDVRRGQIDVILLVPELCYPCGLNEELRANFRLMKDLASCLHMEPSKRVSTMNQFIGSLNSKAELATVLANWGVRVNSNPVEVTGRVLPPQEIRLENSSITGNEKADWTMGLRGVKMFTSVPLIKWVILVSSRDVPSVGNLVSTMQRVATPLGYQIRQPEIIRVNDNRTESYLNSLTQVMSKYAGSLDMIFVVLGNNNLDTYGAVKKRCSKDYGIPSQCFLSKNLNSKGLMSICTKMVIQMNAKQGGEPWSITVPLKFTMVLGYDVHHAGAGGGISVGAMTATVNHTLGRYFSCVEKLPAERQEIANLVARMFEKCLRAYARKNEGSLPLRIIMYRDGVGEGQLRDVSETEVAGFKEKIAAVYDKKKQPKPKFTYIIVNKRINTRLFQGHPNGYYDNPMPGTIVDDVVTRPERYDFFLVSQIARQGCVSPTYYNVISDDSQLPPDKLQTFTYRLCHLYYNWSGTVAVPGPCQNAHKYALQAGTAIKAPASERLEFLLHFL